MSNSSKGIIQDPESKQDQKSPKDEKDGHGQEYCSWTMKSSIDDNEVSMDNDQTSKNNQIVHEMDRWTCNTWEILSIMERLPNPWLSP